jgi:superoxide dismutase
MKTWRSNCISAETIEYHYGKHHAGYVTKLNAAIEGTDLASKSLVDIVREGGGTFNNAAQVWNHTFYWNSIKPGGGGQPSGAIADAINGSFGSYDKFREEFSNAAATQFGSGDRCLGACVLHRLPERAPQLHQDVPRFAGQLGLRESELERLSQVT